MVYMTLLGWFVAIVCVLVLVAILISDTDLTTKFYERFGVQNGENLKNKVVWITGASSGIGEELAYQLCAIGSKLILSARRKSELERVKSVCLERGVVKEDDIMVLPLDLCVFDSHTTAAQRVLEKFGQIDILVNNAGRWCQRAYALDTSLEVDRECLRLNVIGTVSLTKAVLPHMVERKSGHIVVVSSIAGKLAAPLQSAYSAAKGALQMYFDVLRSEVYDENVTVTTVCPGPVVSKIVENALTDNIEKSAKDAGIDAAMQYSNRMSTARCAQIIVNSMANKLEEVWCSNNPALVSAYIGQYMPTLAKFLLKFYARKRIKALKRDTSTKKTN